MKIGVISDTHGSKTAWEMAESRFFSDADLIVHCGDFMYHGPRNRIMDGYDPLGLAALINASAVPVIASRGNCDSEVDESLLDIPLASPYALVDRGGRRIVITHGHLAESDEEKDALAKKLGADVFISGHTHIPVIERRGGVIFLNPGSPSLSKRDDGRNTVAVITDGEISAYDVCTGEKLLEAATR